MKFLLITLGSTGDIVPFLHLSRELSKRGHECILATQAAFQKEAEAYPVTFIPLFQSEAINRLDSMMLDIFLLKSGRAIVDHFYELVLSELRGLKSLLIRMIDESDCVLASYLFPFFALFAEKRGTPAKTISLSHRFYPSSNHQPFCDTRVKLPFGSISWDIFFRYLNHKLQFHLRKTGLLHLLPEQYRIDEWYQGDKTIIAVPSVFEENLDPGDREGCFIGALRDDTPAGPLPPEVEQFLGNTKIPLLNFGSVTFPGVENIMKSFIRHWPAERKILMQSGWAKMCCPNPPSTIRIVGSLPHASLLHRISVMVHHGGAGTTATALHAGIPQIIIPHIADQWFFAHEITRLGAGIRLPRKNWPRRLPQVLQSVESNAKIILRAQELGQALAHESGVINLADRLENWLKKGALE